MVTFEPKRHKYFNGEKEYISVTTLIHGYAPEFDEEYWSTYKAIKDTVINELGMETWNAYKTGVGGWENVVRNYNAGMPVFMLGVSSKIRERQQYYKDKWKEENLQSTERGTAIHNEYETDLRTIKSGKKILHHSLVNPLERVEFDKWVYHNELLVYNHEYGIAGQIDHVQRHGRVVNILDYKTNKKLEKEGFRGETMYPPLAHYQNANFWHYTLQLSLYAWILEQYGYEIGTLTIKYIDHDDNEEFIPIEYVKNDIELMLKDYKENKDAGF